MSVLRAVKKRKKVRKLGAIDIIRREAYADLELDAKVELIRALVPLGGDSHSPIDFVPKAAGFRHSHSLPPGPRPGFSVPVG